MPYNTIVRSDRYHVTPAVEAARLSALRAVEKLLEPVRGLRVAHRRELLSISLWKWTEAAGVAPNSKFNVQYATPAALDHATPAKVNHEHVWPRKWIIDRLLEPGKTWAEGDLRGFLEEHGVACIVTVEEHARLGVLGAGAEGWERYAKAGLRVRDLAGDGFLDLGQPNASVAVTEPALTADEKSVVLEPGEELAEASSEEPGLSVGQAFDRFSGTRAPLLKRLLETADLAGGVGLVGSTTRKDASVAAYVRVHDATLSEQIRAVAFVHWSGKVSLGLSFDELPDGLTRRPEVHAQSHRTYGVSCKVSDKASLATAEELVALALEKVRANFGPVDEDADET